jgi:membrane protease YdiL (CAAX protease family)
LAPLIIIGAGGVLAAATGVAQWAPSGQAGDFGPWLWPAIFAVNVLYAALTSALFEEIGWRGYFVPRLAALGERRAMLISGFLHGVFHLPVAFLTGLYMTEGDRWVVVPLFLVSATAFGVFAAWLRLQTGSVWPAVLAHAVHNVAIMWFGDLLQGDGAAMEHLAGESGAVTLVLYVGLAAVLLRRAQGPAAASAMPRGGVPSVAGAVR